MPRPLPSKTRPGGIRRTAAAAFKARGEHGGDVAIQPAEAVRASFRPGTSPSASARKILALLLSRASAAWAAGEWPEDGVFRFSRSELRGSSHESTDRVNEYLREFAAIEISTVVKLDGEEADRIEPLLRHRIVARSLRPGAPVALAVSDTVRELISASDVYARLHVPLLLALESRYAVTLYGLSSLIVGRTDRPYEELTLDQVRARFGIEGDAYKLPKDVRRLLEGAARDVTQLAPFAVQITPLRMTGAFGAQHTRGRGAAIVGFRIYAQRKSLAELQVALREASVSREGRKARRDGRAEKIIPAIAPQVAAADAAMERAKTTVVLNRAKQASAHVRLASLRAEARETKAGARLTRRRDD